MRFAEIVVNFLKRQRNGLLKTLEFFCQSQWTLLRPLRNSGHAGRWYFKSSKVGDRIAVPDLKNTRLQRVTPRQGPHIRHPPDPLSVTLQGKLRRDKQIKVERGLCSCVMVKRYSPGPVVPAIH